jgi:uroporphyrinogen decarboxylase
MLKRHIDFLIALYDDVLGQVSLDYCYVWEDMAYKNGPLVSPNHFKKHFLPCYKRLTNFLRDHGIDVVMVDCDGDVYSLLPLFLEGGANYLFPMEVAAGMDICKVRDLYPDLVIGGGMDKQQIARGKDAIDKELEKVEYMMNQGGRWFPHVDHLVDPQISWENFLYYRKQLKAIVDKCAASRKKNNQVAFST